MKICERALNFVQIIDHEGTVRICGWINGNIIGKLSESSMEEIWKGEKAECIRKTLMAKDYSRCYIDACPYLSMGTTEEHTVEIESLPQYPQALYLAFEEVCNYHCVSCTTPETMIKNREHDLEAGYKMIEEKLKDVLPHVKKIGANGRGELFASKHTLKLLSEWKPLAPKEECSVVLETNGSLFDEEHWKQIENLGQYDLKVAITVMSFDEKTYQILSGTKLPISQVEENLRFVKSLREKRIVNNFEIATVYQERNFRTLPQFARRCVEEFGADYVRLRPYAPWGSNPADSEWFFDVRGKYHPYHAEFLEVMKDPIFKHPKVHDWGGGLNSLSAELPSVIRARALKESVVQRDEMLDVYRNLLAELISEGKTIDSILEITENEPFLVYGLGAAGKSLVTALSDRGLKGILDCYSKNDEFLNKKIFKPDAAPAKWREYNVLITPLTKIEEIRKSLQKQGFCGKLINVYDALKKARES